METLVTFKIRTRDMHSFQGAFSKLARKAAKLGVEAPTFRVLGDEVIGAVIDPDTGDVLRPGVQVTHITVNGQAPKLDGWLFVATIQHGEHGNIIHSVPGTEFDATPFREVSSNCDHCKTFRRRNDTYIVQHDDGRVMQVGRNCLKDFTGHKSPEAVARWAELLSVFVLANNYDPDMVGGGREFRAVSLVNFLAQTIHEIGANGWLSKTVARDQGRAEHATATQVWGVLFMTSSEEERIIRDEGRAFLDSLFATEADAEKARDTLERAVKYFDDADDSGITLGDYEWKLRMVVQSNSVDYRTSGLAASIVPWMERMIGREMARRKRAERSANSQYIGNVKERREFKGVTIEHVFDSEGQYGWTHFHVMTDAGGNCLTWRSSTRRLDPGSTVDLKGTIKDHTEYRGTKQTVLTRCAVMD